MKKQKTIIIAEIGVNHNGNINLAYKLIDKAAEAGADFAKFQTSIADYHISKHAEKAEYQKKNTNKNESQVQMARKLCLKVSDFPKIYNYCKKKKIKFLSSPFDIPSIKFLKRYNKNFYKIPSGEITNLPYLEEIGKLKSKIILSTGMSSIKEISEAIKILINFGTKKRDITILHCNTEYPTPYEDVNLRAMVEMKNFFNCTVGYSDHTSGIIVPIMAVSLGAKVIEKHLTLDRKMTGPDHKASIEPFEFTDMVQKIRLAEKILGSSEKKITKSEKKNIKIARKSIVASKKIFKGEIFTIDNLLVKRPFVGISPMNWYKIIGKKAKKNFDEDEIIKL